MKKVLFAAAFSLALMAGPLAHAETYGFDLAHSHVGFSVKHILSKVPGSFKSFDGSFRFDPKKPGSSKVEVTIPVDSISTDNDMRDKHLKSPDFFDAAKYPTITFKSKKVTVDAENKYKVEGDLTIHGVTKPVVLDVDYLGADEMMGAKIVGFSASTKIDRRDYGLAFNKTLASGNLMVGNDVDITLDIAGMDKAGMEKMKKMMQAKPADKK